MPAKIICSNISESDAGPTVQMILVLLAGKAVFLLFFS